MEHEIIVGNIGSVYVGDNGRASGEDVTWLKNGEIHKEFIGSLSTTQKI